MKMDDAQEAMALILTGDAAPEAVGALLTIMRLRVETGDDIARHCQVVGVLVRG